MNKEKFTPGPSRPCPFCGGDDIAVNIICNPDNSWKATIKCLNCHVEKHFSDLPKSLKEAEDIIYAFWCVRSYGGLFEEIHEELERAKILHPEWSEDIVYGAAIVGEEAGELLQAALNLREGKSKQTKEARTEAIQTAAMALRFLQNFDRMR